MANIAEIEGIGEAYAAKLKNADVITVEGLLKAGCEKKGRKEIAEKSGISETLILDWVNRADLTRIKGVSTQYTDLLKHAGVDTIPEMAQRKAENLTVKMAEVNAAKNLVRKLPTEAQVKDWVAQAKELPRIVNY